MSASSAPRPCACRDLHVDCDIATCAQAQYALAGGRETEVTLRKVREGAEKKGCETCATVLNALLIPEIKAFWHESIAPVLGSDNWGVVRGLADDDEEIRVELQTPRSMEPRRYIRTKASQGSLDWRHFNIWRDSAAIATLDSGRPCKAFPPLAYQPVEKTDAPESFDNLKSWIKICDDTHSCGSKDDPILPTRLVKIVDDQVRVVDTRGERGRYTTLSHRWGEYETFKLVTSNSESLTSDFSGDDIPETYRDAIEITRELGLEYIWIDSLCIVQDDLEDWRRESVRMRSVYGNSYLNIAACHALNSHGGAFTTSNLPEQFPAYPVPGSLNVQVRAQPHRTHTDYGSNYTNFSNEILLSRGWVLQERLLAPRVVYYDARELKWECNVAIDCQCGGMGVISNFRRDHHASVSHGETPLPFQWMRISERYSNLQLTYDSDRLVALAGIAAQALKSGRGGRYHAGLWEKDLAHQICWEIEDTHRKPDMYLAPSWSWMSLFGSVSYQNRMDFGAWGSTIAVDITDVQCVTADDTDATGPVIEGFLKLGGRITPMLADLSDDGSGGDPPTYRLTHEETGLQLSYEIQMDYIMSHDEARAIKRVVLLFWGDIWEDNNTFLVLKAVPEGGQKFERLGIFWYSKASEGEELNLLLGLCQPAKDIIII